MTYPHAPVLHSVTWLVYMWHRFANVPGIASPVHDQRNFLDFRFLILGHGRFLCKDSKELAPKGRDEGDPWSVRSWYCIQAPRFRLTWDRLGVLHMKDPPAKLQMWPQWAVAGGSTSKSGGSTGKTMDASLSMHAILTMHAAILSPSFTQMLQLFATWSCLWRPHPKLPMCSYFSISYFSRLKISLFLVYFSLLFPIWCFSFRPDGQISSRPVWKVVSRLCPKLTFGQTRHHRYHSSSARIPWSSCSEIVRVQGGKIRNPKKFLGHDQGKISLGHLQRTCLLRMWHDSFICDMTHLYVTWLIYTWHDSFICDLAHSYVKWLIHMWHDSFICDMTHPYVTWLIHMWHDSFICDMTHSYVTWLIHMW